MESASLSHTFAGRIRKLRAEAGMNQGQFADFVGISRGAMSYYEQEMRVPDISTLLTICEKCKVSADYMLGIIPDQNHAISDVCLETGLYPKAVKKLRLIQQIQTINSESIFETIRSDFDDPDEAMNLTPFLASTAMVNVLLGSDEGLNMLTLLAAIVFDGYLYSNDKKVENPVIRLPKAHSYLEVDYPFENITAALWVNVQAETAKLRDFIHEQEAMKPYYEGQTADSD
jgi:transcriptional regulator with XRE-family HTH domain